MDPVIERLERLEKLIESQAILTKEVLSFNHACKYLELSHSHMYKLTSASSIPHYKPSGKKIYFKRSELDQWLLQNRSHTKDEIEREAANYLISKGKVKL
ncbi:MAG: helix-turn-helix domain-containing protein [Bacteroidia bacterium]